MSEDPQTGDPQTGDPQTGDPQTGDPQTGDPQIGANPADADAGVDAMSGAVPGVNFTQGPAPGVDAMSGAVPGVNFTQGPAPGVNTPYFRRFDCSGVLLPLCSVSFFESVFVMA
jgi:hypothetical protein